MMRKYLWLTVLLLMPLWHNALADVTLDTGYDPMRRSYCVGVTHYGKAWKHWSAYSNLCQSTQRGISPSLGAELYQPLFGDRFQVGLGLTVRKKDEIVSSALRYRLRFSWRLTDGVMVSLVHESNCSTVCDNSLLHYLPRGKQPNLGYNWITLSLRLKR